MTKVICNGLGSGSGPNSKEVPTFDLYPNMITQGVKISISLEAYERLVNWASMGRTLGGTLSVLDAAIEAISDTDLKDRICDSRDELETVTSALDECHRAVRRHWTALPRGEL